MKKKFLSLLLLAFSAIALVACKNNSLDGEYYWISDGRNQRIATIKDNKGFVDAEGGYSISINEDLKTISHKSGSSKYSYNDGKLVTNFTGVEREYFKKGSEVGKNALKKYGYKEFGKE